MVIVSTIRKWTKSAAMVSVTSRVTKEMRLRGLTAAAERHIQIRLLYNAPRAVLAELLTRYSISPYTTYEDYGPFLADPHIAASNSVNVQDFCSFPGGVSIGRIRRYFADIVAL